MTDSKHTLLDGGLMRMLSSILPGLLGGLFGGTAALGLVAPAPSQGATFFLTGDGSPFLLVPLQSRVVHWVNLQPARPVDEPNGYQGLGLALTNASLLGPARPGEDSGDPLAWEKALRQAPSGGSEIVRLRDYSGISVTFPASSLGLVAQLLRTRTRRDHLASVLQQFAEIQRQRSDALKQEPHIDMLRRVLDSSRVSRRFRTTFTLGATRPLDLAIAMAVYRRTHHPAAAINVIVGGFDPVFARRALEEVFKRPVPTPPRVESDENVDMIPDDKRPDTGDTMMIGYVLPLRPIPGLSTLMELLAGDADAYLPDYLRAAGHPNIEVDAQAPFPAPGGIVLIRVTEPGTRIDAAHPLVGHVKEALAKLRTRPPTEDQLRRAIAATRARRSTERVDQEGLARTLAEQWILTGIAPQVGLAGPPSITAAQLQVVAREVLAPDTQSIVLPRVPK